VLPECEALERNWFRREVSDAIKAKTKIFCLHHVFSNYERFRGYYQNDILILWLSIIQLIQ
jgi:hypothetical protein